MMRVDLNKKNKKKIYLTLRHHQAQVEDHDHQGEPNGEVVALNIARYKMTVSSVIWVLMILVACYHPVCSCIHICCHVFYLVWELTMSFVMINSFLNPISLLLNDEGSKTSSEGHDQRLSFDTLVRP